MITDINRKEEIHNTLYHKEWNINTIKGAEAIVMLELLMVIERKGKNIENGKLTIGIDNRN